MRLYPFFILKKISLKKRIISSEEIEKSGDYIYIYMFMFTRSSERIFNQSRYTGITLQRMFSSNFERTYLKFARY